MRQRIEDLGRIAVMLDNLLEHDFFEKFKNLQVRPKDFLDWFDVQDQDFKDTFIHSIGYTCESLSSAIYEIREIARGEDVLNGT